MRISWIAKRLLKISKTKGTVIEYATNTCMLVLERKIPKNLSHNLSKRYTDRKKPPNRATARAQHLVRAT